MSQSIKLSHFLIFNFSLNLQLRSFLVKKLFIVNRIIQNFVFFFFLYILLVVLQYKIFYFLTFHGYLSYSISHLFFYIENESEIFWISFELHFQVLYFSQYFCQRTYYISKFSHNVIDINLILRENVFKISFAFTRKIRYFLHYCFG